MTHLNLDFSFCRLKESPRFKSAGETSFMSLLHRTMILAFHLLW